MNLSWKLQVEVTEYVNDDSGRKYLRFCPLLKPRCTASGSLRFAAFDAWADEPETHAEVRQRALNNARHVIASDAINAEVAIP